jgi:hypothetical protein
VMWQRQGKSRDRVIAARPLTAGRRPHYFFFMP